jgi:hypothetical protein
VALNDSFATVDPGTKTKLTEERPHLLPGVDQLESFGSLEQTKAPLEEMTGSLPFGHSSALGAVNGVTPSVGRIDTDRLDQPAGLVEIEVMARRRRFGMEFKCQVVRDLL